MLNHPGDSLVLQTDFLYMVERVDICIDYLKNHVWFLHFCILSVQLMALYSVTSRKQRSICYATNNV